MTTWAGEEAQRIGPVSGIDVVPGVELSVTIDHQDIHLLGYFVDHTDRHLQEYLALMRDERLKRAKRIVHKLNELGIPLKFDAVLRQAGDASVGRPHVAAALLLEGLTTTYHEAFIRYIGFGKPAYEEKYHVTPEEAIDTVAAAGGLSFIAHPGSSMDERTLLALINAGVDGIEVVHPAHSAELVAHYTGIADEYFLLGSGGSDFHGGKRNDETTLGKYFIPLEQVEMMRRRLR